MANWTPITSSPFLLCVFSAEHTAHWAISCYYSVIFFFNVTFDFYIDNLNQGDLIKVNLSYRKWTYMKNLSTQYKDIGMKYFNKTFTF